MRVLVGWESRSTMVIIPKKLKNISWLLFYFRSKFFLSILICWEWLKMVQLNSFTLGLYEVEVKKVEFVVKVLVYSKSYYWSHLWRYLHGPFKLHGYEITRIMEKNGSLIIYPWWFKSRFCLKDAPRFEVLFWSHKIT